MLCHNINSPNTLKMKSYGNDPSSRTSVDSLEISEGVVLDFDSDNNIIGIDIDNASKKLDLTELVLTKLPIERQKISA